MRKTKIFFMLFFFCVFLISCYSDADKCKLTAQMWKLEAKDILIEFIPVNEEVKCLYNLVIEDDSTNDFFIMADGPFENYEKDYKIELPKLKKWFEKKEGWISREKDTLTVNYKQCRSYSWEYSAYLYSSPTGDLRFFGENWIEKKFDSLYLGNNWFYVLTRCHGCGE